MTIDATAEMQSIAITHLAEGRVDRDTNAQVRAAADAAATSCNAVLAITDTAKSKFAEIAEQESRGLLPKAGADTLRREASEQAQEIAHQAHREFEAAQSDALDLAVQSALPTVALEREVLARQEFSLAIGDAQGPEAQARALGLLQGGSDEAKAVLLSTSFGRQALISKGVRNVDSFLSEAKQTVASQDLAVGAVLAKLDKLGTSFQACGKALAYTLGS
jgi:hypothetical protein